MPAQDGTIRVVSGINNDGTIRAFFIDENDRLVVNQDIRSQLAIAGASHVWKGGVVTGTSSDLYTVPTGYTYYLCDVSLSGHNANAAVQSCYLYIYNGSAEFQFGWKLSAGPSQGAGLHISLKIPVACAEDWYLRATSPVADFALVVFLSGLLVG